MGGRRARECGGGGGEAEGVDPEGLDIGDGEFSSLPRCVLRSLYKHGADVCRGQSVIGLR